MCVMSVIEFALITEMHYPATAGVLGLVICIQVIDLISTYDRSNRELKRFLIAIEYADFSQSFSSLGLGKSYETLSQAFSRVMEKFQLLRMEKEEQFHYLQTVIRNISTGLISFNQDFSIKLFNNTAKKMLSVPMIRHLDDLSKISVELVQALKKMDSKQTVVVKCVIDDELRQFSLSSTFLKQKGEQLTLVSLQDIGNQMEEQEILAWQKLIRVLTHEIMNSITPISSLSATMKSLLSSTEELDDDLLTDLKEALETIASRSEGLMDFVSSYRNLTRSPNPNFKVICVEDVVNSVYQLMENELKQKGVDFHFEMNPPDLKIAADRGLIEQVLINLFLNAVHAMEFSEKKLLRVHCEIDYRNRVLIQVQDSGSGMDSDVFEKVFIPFFTTKKNGSGIGLSLSRQIMRLHKGSIFVKPNQPDGVVFTLRF